MIKVSVIYPGTPGARFDHKYYCSKHMPLVKARLGEVCKYYSIDKGLTAESQGSPRLVRCDVPHALPRRRMPLSAVWWGDGDHPPAAGANIVMSRREISQAAI